MASLVENVNSVIEIFNASKAALRDKGVETSSHAVDIPTEIASITGGDTGNYRYFKSKLTTTPQAFDCGFKPLKVMGVMNVGGDQNFCTLLATSDVTTKQSSGSRYGTQQSSAGSAIEITITDTGFSANVINNNYTGYAEFIAVSNQEASSAKFSRGNYELTKGTALKKIELDFKPQILVINQRDSSNYQNASTRTFIYDESLSTTQYQTIVGTTAAKQALGTTTGLQIYSINDSGFEHRPHGTTTTYWTYYAVGGV